jgi:hypothetical protein
MTMRPPTTEGTMILARRAPLDSPPPLSVALGTWICGTQMLSDGSCHNVGSGLTQRQTYKHVQPETCCHR